MELKNFRLVQIRNQQIIELEFQNQIYDMHNAAEFLKLDYDIKTTILKLYFNYYLNDNDVDSVQITFHSTKFFQISPRDKEIPIDEDDCLQEIIFSKDKFELKFMGGMSIAVESEEVYFELSNK